MKLIKKGMSQSNWEKEYVCSGMGLKEKGGCGALLLVGYGDLFRTYQFPTDRAGDRGESRISFKCSECGVLTNIFTYDVPKVELIPEQEVWEVNQSRDTSIKTASAMSLLHG